MLFLLRRHVIYSTIPIPRSAPVVSISQSCHWAARPGTKYWCVSSSVAYSELQISDVRNIRSLCLVICLMVFDVQIPRIKKMVRWAVLRRSVSIESIRGSGISYPAGASQCRVVSTSLRVRELLSSADIAAGWAENWYIISIMAIVAAVHM